MKLDIEREGFGWEDRITGEAKVQTRWGERDVPVSFWKDESPWVVSFLRLLEEGFGENGDAIGIILVPARRSDYFWGMREGDELDRAYVKIIKRPNSPGRAICPARILSRTSNERLSDYLLRFGEELGFPLRVVPISLYAQIHGGVPEELGDQTLPRSRIGSIPTALVADYSEKCIVRYLETYFNGEVRPDDRWDGGESICLWTLGADWKDFLSWERDYPRDGGESVDDYFVRMAEEGKYNELHLYRSITEGGQLRF